jgi:DNA polymerase III alpha subunit (gram-positive type)
VLDPPGFISIHKCKSFKEEKDLAKESRLQQTKGQFKLAGIVIGLSRDNAFKTGTLQDGRGYMSIRFGVQTSPVNQVYVELFGAEKDVYFYNSKKKDTCKLEWHNRDKAPDGYHIIGTNLTLGKDAKRQTFTEMDAIEYLMNHLHDDDHIWVNGDIQFSQYENKKTGETIDQTKYVIKSLGTAAKPIDFEAADFKELAEFEQEIVVGENIFDKEANKLVVQAYAISYGDKVNNAQFEIDINTHDTLARNFMKKLKVGDWVKIRGKVVNKVETTQQAETDDWGSDPSVFDVVTNTIKCLLITGVDGNSLEVKKYSIDDLMTDNGVSFDDDVPF